MSLRLDRTLIGLSVAERSICAVAVRRDKIVWSYEVSRASGESLQHALSEVLAALPPLGFRRAHLHATVGPVRSQVRNVGEPGWARDRALARAIVAESPSRFFLVNGTPVVTTDVQGCPDGGLLVGAIDRPVVDAVAAVCERMHLRLSQISPAAAVLGYATQREQAVFADGEIALIGTYHEARLNSWRRVRSAELPTGASGTNSPSPALGNLATEPGFVAALGAVRAGRVLQLAHRPRRDASVRGRRLVVTAAVFVLAVIFALTAPPLAAMHRASTARALRATIARSGERALAAERRLGAAAEIVLEMNAFGERRRSATLFLASLSEAVEHPTMLLSLQADTLGGTLVSLTPRASMLMAMLDSVPELTDARIVGPVTQQQAGAAQGMAGMAQPPATPPMERVSVRFVWRMKAQSGIAPGGSE